MVGFQLLGLFPGSDRPLKLSLQCPELTGKGMEISPAGVEGDRLIILNHRSPIIPYFECLDRLSVIPDGLVVDMNQRSQVNATAMTGESRQGGGELRVVRRWRPRRVD